MVSEAEGCQQQSEHDTRLYEYCARCDRTMRWERNPAGTLACARCGNETCYLCDHAYPALRFCSRCALWCAACNQALDAARYAFLRAHAHHCPMHPDGRASWYLPERICGMLALTWDEAIDQAMRAAEGVTHGTT